MRKIQTKSPTRIDLAGGTLDLWPINAILGGTTTINLAISIYTEVELVEREDSQVIIHLEDTGFKKAYSHLVELLNDLDPQVGLIRVQAEYFKPAKGFSIKTRSQSPVGGGLGGSSSLCISLIKAFSTWLDVKLEDIQTVTLAHNLEAQVLGVPTGTQDYVPALLGGLCIIDYTQGGMQLQKMSVDVDYFTKRSFLVYTGRPHHSGLNNWEVLKQFIEKKPSTVAALKGIRRKAAKMRELCLNKKWDAMTGLFQESYQLRTELSPVFTSPEIDRLKDLALRTGNAAVKICGAGGGGCVMVWSAPEARDKVMAECQNAGFQILSAHPVERGSSLL